MKNNEDLAITVVDCTECPLRNDKSKCRYLNCFSRVETALSIKDTNIELAIKEVISYYNKEAENDNVSITAKHMYLLGAEYISQAMNMLKQKLNLED